jgi:hypothetical protein
MIMLSPIYLGAPYFEKLIWVHYVHINLKKEFQCEISVGFPLLYVYQNIELQAAGGQCNKLVLVFIHFLNLCREMRHIKILKRE